MTNTTWRKTASVTAAAAPALIIGGVLVKTVNDSEGFVTVYSRCAAVGGFLVVYLINAAITVNGIRMFIDKPWGMIAPMVIACAGANLITIW